MNGPPNRPDADPSVETLRRIESLCTEFEQAWKSGQAPRIEDYLGSLPNADWAALLRELLLLDVDYRHKLGGQPTAADYHARFPEHVGLIDAVCGELAALVSGSQLPPTDQQRDAAHEQRGAERTIRLKCPHCGNVIQFVELGPGEVTCRNCGSSFQVDLAAASFRGADDLPRSFGRFRVVELIGRGAFGRVYKAYDPELDLTVAIKTPRGGCFETKEEEERFLREARSAARLTHPSIVQVHDVGYQDGLPYIVSGYVQGTTLGELLKSGPPSSRDAAEWVAQIAEALDYAHGQQVVHRDIKPGNILLDSAGRPHVTDFGLARRGEGEITVTLDGQVLGTPAYMSPEQASGDGRNVDARSDVYSLGVVLYELLTGELPFRGSRQMLLSQVLNDEPRPPSSLHHDVPRDLETICLKAMAKEPGRRYQSARELTDDLRRWLGNEPIRARPVGRVERLARWCRRKPLVASLSIAVALSLLAGFCVSTYFAFQADRRADDAVAARRRAESLTEEMAKLADAERTSRRQAERNLYFLRISAADREWLADNVAAAEALLNACPPEYRHWEWHYLKRQCHAELFALQAPQDPLVSYEPQQISRIDADELLLEFLWWHRFKHMEFSPDGRWLATVPLRLYSNAEGKPRLEVAEEIRLADASTGTQRCCMQGHVAPVTCLTFSPDGNWLASGSYDRTVKVWDLATGQEAFTLGEHQGAVIQVAFSPDGKSLASVAKGQLRVWDVTSGVQPHRLVQEEAPFETARVAFSPDSKAIAAIFLNHCWWGPDSLVLDLLFRAWRGRGRLKTWEIDTAKTPRDVGGLGYANRGFLSNDCTDLAFSPDGTRIATLDSEGVSLWDSRSGTRVLTLGKRTVFSTGARSATAGLNEPAESQAKERGLPDVPGEPAVGIFSRIDDFWHRLSFQDVTREPAVGMAFGPDGRRIATTSENGAVRLWDAITGEEVRVFRLPTIGDDEWLPAEIAFSPDGQWIVALTHGKSDTTGVKRWDARTGEEIETIRGAGEAIRMTVSPDSRRIALQSLDGTVKVWETGVKTAVAARREGDRSISTPVRQDRRDVLTSLDGKYRAVQDGSSGAGETPSIKIWDVTEGRERCRLNKAGYAQSFSPDGKLLASMTSDYIVKLWDVTTGKEVFAAKPSVHYRSGFDLWDPHSPLPDGTIAFSPDGRRMASSNPDGTLSLWDVLTGQEVLKLSGKHWKSRVAFSADGRRIVRGLEVWDAGAATAASDRR